MEAQRGRARDKGKKQRWEKRERIEGKGVGRRARGNSNGNGPAPMKQQRRPAVVAAHKVTQQTPSGSGCSTEDLPPPPSPRLPSPPSCPFPLASNHKEGEIRHNGYYQMYRSNRYMSSNYMPSISFYYYELTGFFPNYCAYTVLFPAIYSSDMI